MRIPEPPPWLIVGLLLLLFWTFVLHHFFG